jgi:polysaccharide pyruvyl transferase WcaK-like protein
MRTLARSIARRTRRYADLLFGDRTGRRLPRLRDYLRPTPFALYAGYVGHDNLGDDAVEQAIVGLLGDLPLVRARRTPVELRLRRRLVPGSDPLVFILGGGTLIGTHGECAPLERELARGVPAVTFGTGVRDPAFWSGPEDRLALERAVAAVRRCRRVTVRGPRSATILADHGVPDVDVIGDPALSIVDAAPLIRRTGRVALNLGSQDRIRGAPHTLLDAVTGAAVDLRDRGHELVLVPMHRLDLAPLRALAARLGPGVSLWRDYLDVDATVALLAGCDLVVGQRLHAVVLAFAVGVPAISLAYNPKCDDFMASFDLGDLALPTDRATADTLRAAIADVFARHDAVAAHIRATADRYRARQRAFADDLRAHLGR